MESCFWILKERKKDYKKCSKPLYSDKYIDKFVKNHYF